MSTDRQAELKKQCGYLRNIVTNSKEGVYQRLDPRFDSTGGQLTESKVHNFFELVGHCCQFPHTTLKKTEHLFSSCNQRV